MFINANANVEPLQLRDYPEWHHGRSHYAIWYIEIDNPTIINYCQNLRQQCSAFLHPDLNRQFHITLFVNGFLSTQKNYDDDFIYADIPQQISILKQLELSSFELELGSIGSFQSSLFLSIIDVQKKLQHLRLALQQQYVEIAALEYCPHITLGFYRNAFSGAKILQHIQGIAIQKQRVQIKQLCFGIYNAQTLQGPLTTLYRLDLSDISRAPIRFLIEQIS